MKRKRRFLIAGALLVLIGSSVFIIKHQAPSIQHPSTKATYYCPMHPTYTSDRPGDCPICNMKLVKREPEQTSDIRHQTSDKTRQASAAKDICYLHNCPRVHEGKSCPMLVVAKAGEKVTCPICGTHVAGAVASQQASAPGEKKILYWTDPMIPGYKSDKPGKSPMGMDLIPVYEENGVPSAAQASSPEGYAPILVTPQKRQFIGVETAPAARRSMTKTIRTVGRIAYDPELYQAQETYLQALKGLQEASDSPIPELIERAERLVEAVRMRLRLLGLSNELIEEMATWDGPDKRLLLPDTAGEVWLYAPIYEFELPLVKVGQTITIDVQAIPGKTLEGVIRSIDPVLDPATRSARVRAILTDPEGILKPEMFVNASIVMTIGEVLAIPGEAVFETGTKRIVFVDKGQGLFEPRDVTVGVKADGDYEVKNGITEGELVVTSGNFLIDSESRLKAALQGLSGRPAASEMDSPR